MPVGLQVLAVARELGQPRAVDPHLPDLGVPSGRLIPVAVEGDPPAVGREDRVLIPGWVPGEVLLPAARAAGTVARTVRVNKESIYHWVRASLNSGPASWLYSPECVE